MIKAIADFDRFFALKSDEISFLYGAYLARGEAYSDTGEDGRALTDFDSAVELNSELPLAYKWRAYIYRRRGDKANAQVNEKIADALEKQSKAAKKH